MESLAVARVFPMGVATSGTRIMSGHALGAAGALKLHSAGWPDRRDRPPATSCLGRRTDTTLPRLDTVTTGRCFAQRRRIAMSNSFAFGGNNLSLIPGAAA